MIYNLGFDGEHEHIDVPFKDKNVRLAFAGFDIELNVEEYTTIDYNNIYGELLTIATLINRVGIWKAEAEYQYDMARLNYQRHLAEISESLRKTLITEVNERTKYPSNDQVNNAAFTDKTSILLKGKMYRLKKYHAVLDAFYWGVQNKSTKLNALSENLSLKPVDFESNIMEGKVNGYYIKFENRKSILSNN